MEKVLPPPARDPTAREMASGLSGPTIADRLGRRSVVLVGLMGAGKTTIGRRLASRLGLPFRDADAEIEEAARMPISDIFLALGEAGFRAGEKRVIARLLDGEPLVLATGGGAYTDPETRARIAKTAVSIWLKADHETLMRRVRRRSHRPLLRTADPDETMRRLLVERGPLYALADLTVESRDGLPEQVTQAVVEALRAHLRAEAAAS